MPRIPAFFLILGLTGLILPTASAVRPEDYEVIVNRNPFNIKPPEKIKPPEVLATSTNVNLVGINRFRGKKKVFLVVKDNNKEVSYSLVEGEHEADIEVLSVSDEGIVKLRKGGHELALNLKDHGIQPNYRGTFPLPGAPGVPGALPGNPYPGTPGYNPAYGNQPGYNQGAGVTVRTPTVPTTNSAFAPRVVPTRPMRLGTSTGAIPPPPQQPQLSPQEQQMIIERERIRTRNEVERGDAPPLPPTGDFPSLPQ